MALATLVQKTLVAVIQGVPTAKVENAYHWNVIGGLNQERRTSNNIKIVKSPRLTDSLRQSFLSVRISQTNLAKF